jgi:flavin-dependent dehydrogenase
MNEKNINFSCSIPVKYEADVFVAGGGPSGIAAAVSAARNGASVYLAEAQGCLGGMGTAGLVPVFAQFSDGVNVCAAGVGIEILERLREMGGTGDENGLSIKVEVLKRLYDKMLEEAGVKFSFDTHLIGAETENNSIKYAVLYAKSGIFAVKAKAYVDCTGDADLVYMAGGEFEKGDENADLMPGTICSLWSGIDWKIADRDTTQKRMFDKAAEDGAFTLKDRGMPGIWKISETNGGGNLGHAYDVDPADEVSLTKAFIEQRKNLVEYGRYFKEYLTGFDDLELVSSGNIMGIRESRRIVGDYKLTLDDFNSRAVFDDEIGRYFSFVDIHAKSKEHLKKMLEGVAKYKPGESYGIPYRVLMPKGLSNVLTAGKTISCDRYVLGSIRVMPGCFITGQAAGTAAAMMALQNKDSRSIDIKTLQKNLKKDGAYLPNLKEM